MKRERIRGGTPIKNDGDACSLLRGRFLGMSRHALPKHCMTSQKNGQGCASYILELKSTVLVQLRVLKLKRTTMGAFVVPLRALSRKKKNDRLVCYVRIGTTKQDLGTP